MNMRLDVDPVACDAYGYCAELLPELIGLDEWGYPIVTGEPVPQELADLAAEAVRCCPRRALQLRLTTPAARSSGAPRPAHMAQPPQRRTA
jgi:ferredoxin